MSQSENPSRKYPLTWEKVRAGRVWVGIHTGRANQLAKKLLEGGDVPPLSKYGRLRSEVSIGDSTRIDFLLENPASRSSQKLCYVEVKNVTLARGKLALFPDAVTLRGQKHLAALEALKRKGHRAALLFIVQRGDVDRVAPADAVDPEYGRLLRRVKSRGVEVYAYQFSLTAHRIYPKGLLPLELD